MGTPGGCQGRARVRWYRGRAGFPVWWQLGFEALLGDPEEPAVLALRIFHPDVVRVLIYFCIEDAHAGGELGLGKGSPRVGVASRAFRHTCDPVLVEGNLNGLQRSELTLRRRLIVGVHLLLQDS